MVRMVPALSSRSPLVAPVSPEMMEVLEAETEKYGETSRTPPITSDPPRHRPYRRLIMPFFSPHAVERPHPLYAHALQRADRRVCRQGQGGRGGGLCAADRAARHRAYPGHRPRPRRRVRDLGARHAGVRPDRPGGDAEIPDRHPRVLPGDGDRAPRGAPRRRDLGADRLRGGGRDARRLQDRRHVPAAAGGGHRHHLERDFLLAAAFRDAPPRPGADTGRAGPASGRRGRTAALLLARHHGPHRDGARRDRRGPRCRKATGCC